MKTITKYGRPLAVAMTVALIIGAADVALAAAPSGAIFTTDITGTQVNVNIYNAKTDVYLNGGPQNQNSAGLSPDGVYYFQVTEPSGANNGVLLSTDPAVCRQLRVTGGVVVGAEPATYNGLPCAHPNGYYNSANGSTSVQLMPFNDTSNNGGEYKAWLIAKTANTSIDPNDPAVLVFNNDDTKTDNFKVKVSLPPPVGSNISGVKFYDANVNGILDSNELGIPFWKIALFGDQLSDTTTVSTNEAGAYLFRNLVAGIYGVCEIMPSASPRWIPTTATSFADINVPPDAVKDFGNVCLGTGGGLTLGFWSNKNGQALFNADDLLLMTNLNLRNADGSVFDPKSYTVFRNWLLKATATNMAYMLSAQLSAMELNVLNGKVKADAIVFAGKPPESCTVTGLSNTGFISINNLMSAADGSLLSNGKTVAGVDDPDVRNCQEFMKNALDEANNNRNFVQPTACGVNYSGTEPSCTPAP
ncbi:MAG: SdrD B-like domain-containing protein [Methylococcales bacterium]|nr:SdrD B-like domain-containing protein [Methylococcales bacterium]